MNEHTAISDYQKLNYDLAKLIGKLAHIKDRVSYINTAMNWDGLFEVDFSAALEKLASVQSSMTIYAYEDEFGDLHNDKDND